jgi:hypothetical protein
MQHIVLVLRALFFLFGFVSRRELDHMNATIQKILEELAALKTEVAAKLKQHEDYAAASVGPAELQVILDSIAAARAPFAAPAQ